MFVGQLTMNERCASCGLRFEREPGYFTGAMIVSYMLAVPAFALALLGAWLSARSLQIAFVIAVGALLLITPWVFRMSRVLWMTFDRAVDRAHEP